MAAFQTVPSEVLVGVYEARRKARRPSLVYRGDDETGKGVAAGLIRDAGFDPLDAVPLRIARYTEPFALKLSAKRGKAAAAQIARLLYAMKGAGGGRIYVNEFGAVFSPITEDDELRYVYFGQIDLNSWFPDPMEPASVTV